MRMLKNERGQIYILVALVLAVVLFLLVTQTNIIKEKLMVDRFEQIASNYEIEGSKLINSLLSQERGEEIKGKEKEEEEETGRFFDFTDKFVEYTKTQDPDIGVVYILNYEEEVQVGNRLSTAIAVNEQKLGNCEVTGEISIEGFPVGVSGYIGGCIISLGDISKVEIIVPGEGDTYTEYKFDIKKGTPQLQMVIRKDEENQTKVYYKR